MASCSKKEYWTSEEDQKFIKRKALYKKAGLSNVFKNGTKTLEEIRSRIKYLTDMAEWTLVRLEKPQWKLEMEEMKDWLKEFEKKVNKEYNTSMGRIDEKEKIWNFNEEVYENELLELLKEEQEGKSIINSPAIITRRQTKIENENSFLDSNVRERKNSNSCSTEMAPRKNKMADKKENFEQKNKSNTTIIVKDDNTISEEIVDYPWSDDSSMNSNFEMLQTPNETKNNASKVENWLEETNEIQLNSTPIDIPTKNQSLRVELLERKIQKLIEETEEKEKIMKQTSMEPKITEQMQDLMEKMVERIKKEMDEGFKNVENKVKNNDKQIQQVANKINQEIDEKFGIMAYEIKKVEMKTTNVDKESIRNQKRDESKSEFSQTVATIEKKHIHEIAMKQAMEAIPKFDGSLENYNTWKERIMEVMDEFGFLNKKSYVKCQMMLDRMEQEPRKGVLDLAQLQDKAFESAIDRLDRKYEHSTLNERMMAKVIEIAKMDNNDKEKWKSMKLHLDAVNITTTEIETRNIIDLIIITSFDTMLKEKWRNYSLRRRGEGKLLIMRNFLEKLYERALEKSSETEKKRKKES